MLIKYCREHLSGVSWPKSIDVVEALPRHANGKLLKRALKAPYWPAG
ncbi:MAG: hypothetical protein AAF458_17610 [Pseudomonadota bacterium]